MRAGRILPRGHRSEGRLDRTGRARSACPCARSRRRIAGARNPLRNPHHRRPDAWPRQGHLRLLALSLENTMLLENKVAIVTGAASGIGRDIAMLFAREGAGVVIADLNQKGADAVASELGGAKRAIGVERPTSTRNNLGLLQGPNV